MRAAGLKRGKEVTECVAAGFALVCDWSVETATRKSMQTAPIFNLPR